MIDAKILSLLLFIIFNNICGTNGTGEENENDLLFGGMWRKAFELNPQKLAQLNSDQKMEEKPKGIKIENEEDDDQKMGEKENKFKGKIKMEPIFDQTEGKDSDQKNDQKIKKEPKIKTEILKNLGEKWNTESNKNEVSSAQNESDQSADHNKKMDSEKKKLEILKEFEKMRKKYKRKNKEQHGTTIAREIAKKLGESLKEIYKWRKEIPIKESINYETKQKIIKEFEKMKKEYKMKNTYKREYRNKIETEFAKALGTSRYKIYEWKKELRHKKEHEAEGGNGIATISKSYAKDQKTKIIEHFDKLVEEFSNKFNAKMSIENKSKMARKFGVSLRTIYGWKSIFKKTVSNIL